MTAESRVVEAANPKRARAKDGAGFGRAGFTASSFSWAWALRSMGEKPRAGRERGEDAEENGQEIASHVRSEANGCRCTGSGFREYVAVRCAQETKEPRRLGTGRAAGRCGEDELCRQTMIRIGWPSLAVAAVLVLGIANGASGQGLAVNPSAAASDIRNPSSTNPAAAASDVRNPSAFNPAAAASDIRQPSVASPSSPAAMAPRVRRTRVVLPERRSRASQRARRAPAAARQAATRERRAAEARPRPATTAERKASAIMGSVCRGC
jgi:hypothetical protein